MKNPVITRCGHSFEKQDIENWLIKNNACPLCREKIDKTDLVANRVFQSITQQFLSIHEKITKEKIPINIDFLNVFECPITHVPMKNPVIARCGHSFEKQDIENWLKEKNICPICKEKIDKADLVANRILQRIIQQFLIPINIHLQSGYVVKLDVLPSKTIESIKKEIDEKTPDFKWCVLTHNAKRLEENKTLADYNFQKETHFEQTRPIQIFVKPFNKTVTLNLLKSDTYNELMNEFAKKCIEKKIFSIKDEAFRFRLNYKGNYIREDHTLDDYNIEDATHLEVFPNWGFVTCPVCGNSQNK